MASRFLQACRNQPVDRMPVWFMRQAGRYQAQYRQWRKEYTFQDLLKRPEVCAKITLFPVEDLQVDAAILFSDIMVPLEPMGISYTLKEHIGPVVADPIRTRRQVDALRPLSPSKDLPEELETVARVVHQLGETPLIGFAGAPFTLASYIVEGGPSRTYYETKRMMWTQPQIWQALMQKLAESAVVRLQAQV
ncbi:MAG: uroporphyrinogen decarboxylase, partial [Firmicutes bacterium]|nr:uroporphyrinogen decarboxylase [Bacillota bacterium]